jgi:hypothetical protein
MASSSTSYGHAVRRMTPQELVAYGGKGHKCAGKCLEKAIFEVSFRYVTGRTGRTTRRCRPACQLHAERFAVKNSLGELPTEPRIPDHPPISKALDQIGVTSTNVPSPAAMAAFFQAVAAHFPGLPGRLCDYTVACRTCEAPLSNHESVTGVPVPEDLITTYLTDPQAVLSGYLHIGEKAGAVQRPCVESRPALLDGWDERNRALFRYVHGASQLIRPAGARYWWEQLVGGPS